MRLDFLRKGLLGATALGFYLGMSLAGGIVAKAEDITLNMSAPDWFPTRALQELANGYKAESGANVKIKVDFIPWGSYYERLAASFASGEEIYQMAVIDSQWIGTFVEAGNLLQLDDIVAKDPKLQEILADVHPAFIDAYSTYPYGSDTVFGFPQMPDTMVAYFRTDLFCHAGEASAFKAKYNMDLPCSYEEMSNLSWDDLEKISAFFTRKAGETLAGETLTQDFYGIAMNYSKVYDFVTMMAAPFFWQWDGSIWDETKQPSGQAKGVVNSDANVAAFERFLSFLPYNPPGAASQGIDEINAAFAQGRVAYALNWAAVGAPILDPSSSVVTDKFANAQPPGRRKADGSLSRYWNVGGQPFVLTSWNNDTVVKESIAFVKWWLSDDVQRQFAERGGSVSLKSINSQPDYVKIKPWNRAFVDSLDYQKDIWHVPEFFELIVQQQEQLNASVTKSITVKQALDNIAAHQDDVLREAGRIE